MEVIEKLKEALKGAGIEITEEQSTKLQEKLPGDVILNKDDYIAKSELESKYIEKAELDNIVSARLSKISSDKKSLKTQLTELNKTIGEKDAKIEELKTKLSDFGNIDELQEQIKEFQNAEKERWTKIVKPQIEGSDEKIKKMFILPEKNKELDIKDIHKNLVKFTEYEGLRLFSKGTQFEGNPPGGGKKKYKSPFTGMG